MYYVEVLGRVKFLSAGVSCGGCMGMVVLGIHIALGDHEGGHAQKHRPVAQHR